MRSPARLLATHLRSHAVAYAAIFVAMGGTSYAAVKIPNNSVGNKQLKANAVDTKKVKDGTLTITEFKAGEVPVGAPGPKGDIGDIGPQGLQGVPGEKGASGDRGDAGVGTAQIQSFNQGAVQTAPAGPPNRVVRTDSFTTTAASTTVIFRGQISIGVNCSSGGGGSCTANEIGVFVDGVGVPGTRQGLSGFAVPEGFSLSGFKLSASGILTGVGPGSHQLQFGYTHSGGNELFVTSDGASGHLLLAPQ